MACRLYTIKSKRENVPATVDLVMDFIEVETDISGCDCIRDIKVVLSELLTNAIIHGNGSNSEKPVDVNVDIEPDIIRIKVTDRGPSFKPDENMDEDILSENGRGLKICHILCRKLEYSFEQERGNTATAVFYIKE